MEQFFASVFENAPPGTLFYAARVFKQIKKAFPKFYTEPSLLIADAKDHPESDQADFYFSPAYYSRKTKAIKSNVRGAGCVWVDCDDGLPDFDQEPNFILETSPEHYHCYWLLGEMRKPDEVEAINRTLAYQYNTDKSGWDSTQLLRPPGSYNRKRSNFRTTITRSDLDSRADFSSVDPGDYRPLDKSSVGSGTDISVESLLAELVFTQRVRDLIFKETESKSGEGRSGLIFNTACELVKMHLKDAEILTLLEFQDLRLQKYVNHSDRRGVLQGIVNKAREKEKTGEPKTQEKPLYQIFQGNEEFFTHVEDDKYLCEHLVFEDGILIIGGEPGAGKSRFALNLVDCLACGQNFLGKEIEQAIKCAYLCLDMPARRVRGIRQQQFSWFSAEERELINQNVTLLLRGSGMDMANKDIQKRVADDLLNIGAQFIVIDVLGRALPTLIKDKPAQKFLNWMQEYINENNVSFGLVSHTRKVPAGTKSGYKLDDLYGSRHWSITPDTCLALENQGNNSTLIHINKDRSGELGEELRVKKHYTLSVYSAEDSEPQPDKAGEELGGQIGKM